MTTYKTLNEDSLDFLKKLLNTHSPSGYEIDAAKVFSNYMQPFCDTVSSDILCNTVAVLSPKANFKVMLAAHYDEVGLQVTYIDDDGFIYFRPVGGIDYSSLPGSMVKILSCQGHIHGIIGQKPLSLRRKNDGVSISKIQDLWIDTGMEEVDEIKSKVPIGTFVAILANYKFLSNHRIVSKALDDKIGVFIVAETMKKLSKSNIAIGVYGVATSQEEIGTRGITTAAYQISPKLGIICDVATASDTPNSERKLYGELKLGKGPGICRGADTNYNLVQLIESKAREINIPYQNTVGHQVAGGTDVARAQLTRNGIATSLISIPNRYMHSATEICDLRDIDNTIFLLSETIKTLKGNENFLPISNEPSSS